MTVNESSNITTKVYLASEKINKIKGHLQHTPNIYARIVSMC